MKYESKNHSKYLLMYHVIFVCRYRRKILEPISEALKNAIIEIEKYSDFKILEMETDKDHIHLLVKSEPKISTLAIIRKLKQCTTISLWKTHKDYLKKYYWKEHTLWSDGYFVCSVGNTSKGRIHTESGLS
jgi:putative transposase